MSQRHTPKRRVVITGVGVISPIGIGREAYWANLAAAKNGVGPVTAQVLGADCLTPGRFVGAEVADFDEQSAREFVPKNQRKSIKVMCRDIQMGTASAMLAVKDAGLDVESIDSARMGVDFGANLMYSPPTQLNDPCWNCVDENQTFVMDDWAKQGLTKMEPLWLLKYLPNMPACHIAIFFNAHGPSNSVTQNEASGNLALGEALGIIQRGAADVMIAGATGARLHQFKVIQAALWGELGYRPGDPAASCRPFDVERTGEVAGEGACSFVLEEEGYARARGATILGYLSSCGSSCVAGNPRLAVVNATRAALRAADMTPEDIGHINAHGLGDRSADLAEAHAIHEVFGPRGADIPVTSLKGAMGNSAAGSGTLELAGSVLSLQHGFIPPTLHCDTPDPECQLNVVRNEPRSTKVRSVLKVNFTRFGQASAVIVQSE